MARTRRRRLVRHRALRDGAWLSRPRQARPRHRAHGRTPATIRDSGRLRPAAHCRQDLTTTISLATRPRADSRQSSRRDNGRVAVRYRYARISGHLALTGLFRPRQTTMATSFSRVHVRVAGARDENLRCDQRAGRKARLQPCRAAPSPTVGKILPRGEAFASRPRGASRRVNTFSRGKTPSPG